MGKNSQIRETMAKKKVLAKTYLIDTFVHRDMHLAIHVVTRV